MKIDRVNLDGTWQLRYGPQEGGPTDPIELSKSDLAEITAEVPGNVINDLVKAGVLPELHINSNVYEARGFESCQWWYSREFKHRKLKKGERAELRFEGIDCLATIWLNGHEIGQCDNMLIPQTFDVTDHLKTRNALTIRIDSAVIAGRAHQQTAWEQAAVPYRFESLSIRKAPHMFGSDNMPRLVGAGLWRSVSLSVLPQTRLLEPYWATSSVDAGKRTASLINRWQIETNATDLSKLNLQFTIERNNKVVLESKRPVLSTEGCEQMPLADVDLWWPRGYGEPALYDATVRLFDDSECIDEKKHAIGIRSITFRQTNQDPFQLIVNDEPIFIRGANWGPLDAFHSRDTEHLDATLELVTDLNCNMLRCWGGNVYEDDAFFDFCDANGIMIWQDFAFADGLYPQDESFARRATAEAASIIKKLRNHSSLAMWVGNAGGDSLLQDRLPRQNPKRDALSRRVLSEAVRCHDLTRPYLPSAPYAKLIADIDGLQEDYKSQASGAQIISKVGYISCPDKESLEQMFGQKEIWPWQDNDAWLVKAVCPVAAREIGGITRLEAMAKQILHMFGHVPEDLDAFILASQFSQAEATKFHVESKRISKGQTGSGAFWWFLRDGWPVISEAVVDYDNRKKIAYDYIKRIQTDVVVICGEEASHMHPIHVVNDSSETVKVHVLVVSLDDSRLLLEERLAVAANSSEVAGYVPARKKPGMWLIEAELENSSTQFNHYLAGPGPVELKQYEEWAGKIKLARFGHSEDVKPVKLMASVEKSPFDDVDLPVWEDADTAEKKRVEAFDETDSTRFRRITTFEM